MENNPNNLIERLTAGLLKAQRNAVEKSIATNTPLVVWRDGKVVKIPPEELGAIIQQMDASSSPPEQHR
jgi:hypothetical protein